MNECHQYIIRQQNLQADLARVGLSLDDTASLRTHDFNFSFVPKTDRTQCNEVIEFINRHEWLGKMSHYPTHRFVARYNGTLAGVVVMDQPNAFSKLLGENTRKLERLISRGACISWSPRNLASCLIMWSIRWMVKNTSRRLFTAYSDPLANEIGQIYQACNFIYLGQRYGTTEMYLDPNNSTKGWFTERSFRSRSAYKKYARELQIEWEPGWQNGESIVWEMMPPEIENAIRQQSKRHKGICTAKKIPPKHKYCYILGSTQSETKKMKRIFAKRNPRLVGLKYPKRVEAHLITLTPS